MVEQYVSPPFFELDFGQESWKNQSPIVNQDNIRTPRTETDPSDLGQYVDKAATLYIPSLQRPENEMHSD